VNAGRVAVQAGSQTNRHVDASSDVGRSYMIVRASEAVMDGMNRISEAVHRQLRPAKHAASRSLL
jgi:hypothetical protein